MKAKIKLITTSIALLTCLILVNAGKADEPSATVTTPAAASTDTETETPSATPTTAVDIHLGNPGYGGSGCPIGTASAVLSPDKKSFKIIFDQYVAKAGGNTGISHDRKSCNLSIPISVPTGYSISLYKLYAISGYVNIPLGGQGEFNLEHFFAGTRGPAFKKIWSGPIDSNYIIETTPSANSVVWSPCGQSVNFRINSSVYARTNSNSDEVMATVDTGIEGKIQWRACR
ncbi:MAG: DUF4360 domain-containing protein [Oligoflexia bacterium]|nr:DUF4360 domain-containing protein [Oligoflexia bacterium]